MHPNHKDNSRLATITMITALGDFLSFFAILQINETLFKNSFLAGYAIFIKSGAIAAAGLILPKIISRISVKRMIFLTQALSAFFIFLLLAAYSLYQFKQPIFFFSVIFALTFLKHVFESSRESASKSIAQSHMEHRPLQAQLLHSLYSAQFLGPILAYFLITYTEVRIPLGLDLISFIISSILALRLTGSYEFSSKSSVFSAIPYLRKNKMLLRLFLFRTFGFFIAVSISNLAQFSIVKDTWGLKLINSAWIYAATGLGAMIGVALFRHARDKLHYRWTHWQEGSIAFIGQIIIGLGKIGLVLAPTLFVGMIVMFFNGIGLGLNALSTQTLRRKLCDKDEFPSLVGLELVTARVVDWGSGTIFVLLLSGFNLGVTIPMYFSAFLFFVMAILHLSFNVDEDWNDF